MPRLRFSRAALVSQHPQGQSIAEPGWHLSALGPHARRVAAGATPGMQQGCENMAVIRLARQSPLEVRPQFPRAAAGLFQERRGQQA